MSIESGLWTLDELTAQVAAALAEGYEGASSGRVRDIPDRRTIRYYMTLGLLDRPAAMQGRTALYGRRHLLQLVAIKKLQASGRSLSEVQAALAGQADAELARFAGLPDPGSLERVDDTAARGTRGSSRSETEDRPRQGPEDVPGGPSDTRSIPPVLLGFPLHPGVTILLNATRAVDDRDLEAIRTAAVPLLERLMSSGLVESRQDSTEP